MSFDRRKKTPRWPRYCVAGERTIQAEIERAAGRLPASIQVELRDLSRTGYQFKTSLPLEIQEAVLLRLRTGELGSELALQGTVRWMRPTNDGTWLVGCRTESPMEWDALGELFLNGVLSPNGPS